VWYNRLVPTSSKYSLVTTTCKHGFDSSGFIKPAEFLASLGDYEQLSSLFLPVIVRVYSRALTLGLLLCVQSTCFKANYNFQFKYNTSTILKLFKFKYENITGVIRSQWLAFWAQTHRVDCQARLINMYWHV